MSDVLTDEKEMLATIDVAEYLELQTNLKLLGEDNMRLTKRLHAVKFHPDFEYAETEGARKQCDGDPPPGDGWEINEDYHDGFSRFTYHEEYYWRRRKVTP